MTQSIPAQEKASTAVQCQNWPEQASPSRYVSKQRIFPVELEFFRVKEKKLKHVFILFNFLKYILTGFHKWAYNYLLFLSGLRTLAMQNVQESIPKLEIGPIIS